ncbi:MAG: glycoside hydrolase family 127 protein [Armatimonadetes bacterium]|nr:glycoside hydrolase family 127 protein [Armatimonadota bacterium]
MAVTTRPATTVPLGQVSIDGGYWGPRLTTNRTVTLPIELDHCRETGRIDAFRMDWRPGQPNPPHIFWDSDVAKWLESACYSLITSPDAALRSQVDEVVDLIVGAQQPDGYLNVHFTLVEPEKRWTNTRDWHELYCAGHLMEAAVAHHQATGERRLLEALERYADLIATVFGREPGQKPGYPGHEEIELALVKLFRETGEERFLNLARYFIDQRGQQPHWYDDESRARGEDPGRWYHGRYDYNQSHLPVREQTSAEGHAVRAMYLYSGMADLVAETGDEALWAALLKLWDNVTQRRMYLTGGVGSGARGERFTGDYDLPNETAYAETCAAIGLVFWAHRMLKVEPRGEFADVLERALYNGVMSGVSLSGDLFFYANPLAVDPRRFKGAFKPVREPWFGTACCPTNIVRLLASLGSYIYTVSDQSVYTHLYLQSTARLTVDGQEITLRQQTGYPYDETVELQVEVERAAAWTLALRLPGWCRGVRLTVNSTEIAPRQVDGYALIERVWHSGDQVALTLAMPAERVYCRPEVAANAGRVALQRGPLVYCLEEADNGPGLAAQALSAEAPLTVRPEPELCGGTVVIEATAERAVDGSSQLYDAIPAGREEARIRAIPYALWQNRGEGEMMVWLRETTRQPA